METDLEELNRSIERLTNRHNDTIVDRKRINRNELARFQTQQLDGILDALDRIYILKDHERTDSPINPN